MRFEFDSTEPNNATKEFTLRLGSLAERELTHSHRTRTVKSATNYEIVRHTAISRFGWQVQIPKGFVWLAGALLDEHF